MTENQEPNGLEKKSQSTGHVLDNPLLTEYITCPPEKPILEEEVKYLPAWYRNTVFLLALYITAIPIYTAACAALTAGAYKLFGGSGSDGAGVGAFFGFLGGITFWATTHDYLVQGLPRRLIDKQKKKLERTTEERAE